MSYANGKYILGIRIICETRFIVAHRRRKCDIWFDDMLTYT